MADTKSLIGLIGFYDNLSEPMPLSNYPETIIALAVTFLVRRDTYLIIRHPWMIGVIWGNFVLTLTRR